VVKRSPIQLEDLTGKGLQRYIAGVHLGVNPDIFTSDDFKALAMNAAKGRATKDELAPMDKQSMRDQFKPVNISSESFKKWFGGWDEQNGGRTNERESEQKNTGFDRETAPSDRGAISELGRIWRVDQETGKPRIFYHGPRGDIKQFDKLYDHEALVKKTSRYLRGRISDKGEVGRPACGWSKKPSLLT
jgi:hypothetical protein